MSKQVAAVLLLLSLSVAAERAWVTNRGASSVDLFDTLTGAHEGSVTVGASPVDIASDSPDTYGPFRLFVANSGSNSVSVIQVNPLVVGGSIFSLGSYGTFATPSGIARTPWGAMVVVDQKPTSYYGTPDGRSTIRFFSPTSYAHLESYRDASPTARYQDVVVTSNGKLWIADDGDQGVTVVRFPAGQPPFYLPTSLIYNGSGEFADFLHGGTTPTFLVAPRRLATDGTSKVVVADAGSTNVTIIDADTQGMQHVDLGAGALASDVEVVGGFAYVTTAGVNNLHRIDLTTLAVSSTVLAGTVAGLGASSDGATLLVGAGAGSGLIVSLDLTVAWPPAPVPVPAFPTPGSFPFGFYVSVRSASAPPATTPPPAPPDDPPFISQSNTTSTSNGSGGPCGLLGLEALAVLLLRRRRRA